MRGGLRVLCAAGVIAAVAGCGRQGGAPAPAADQPVALDAEDVAVVEERTLRTGPEVSGTLRARREAAIRAEVSGAVLDVLVEAGERVKPGQTLARIDDAALTDALLAARSGVAAAKNALRVAESNAERARTLAREGALSAQEAEQAEAGLEAARAQLADAEARLSQAAQQVAKARVRAPFEGVVSLRQVSAGDVVAPGAALFTIIDPTRLQLEGSVPAARLGEARPGAPVEFTVTGFGDRAFQGEIERVAPAVDPATGQVRLFVELDNADGRLISGLYAQGRVAAQAVTALAVPVAAVDGTTDPPTVVKIADGKARRAAVALGLRDEVAGAVAITSGVAAGDQLVLGEARASLADGTPVAVERERVGRRSGGAPGAGN